MQSPCTGNCCLEENICKGCGRTREEIIQWSSLSKQKREEIMERLNE